MTEASLTRIEYDPTLAEAFLTRAKRFLQDGSAKTCISREGRQILLHNAAIAACDSILAVTGFEVEGSEGGHQLRLDKAQDLLGGDLVDLFERLDSVRIARGEASYRAGFVADANLEEAVTAVTELVQHAEDYVGRRLDA